MVREHVHEDWQIQDGPLSTRYCAACGATTVHTDASLAARARALRLRLGDLGKEAGQLALDTHRTKGGSSRLYGQLHTAINDMAHAMNRLLWVARELEQDPEIEEAPSRG